MSFSCASVNFANARRCFAMANDCAKKENAAVTLKEGKDVFEVMIGV